ncbi:MAG: PPOX class F420-dependent oxidoreductase [Actinomycetota bacterium]|nr:PPOX class F420-dependent oxidoreductase [Actinomycetota bacterium]
MAQQMTNEEYKSFMLDRARTAVLATVRTDGRPHTAPIWFDLEGDALVFTTGESTVKGRNMRRDPRVSLCIDEEEPPFHFVVIEGNSELTAGDSDLLYWATRIGGRYMGADRADEYGRRNAVEGELLVRVTPQKVVAYKNISD